MIWGYLTYLCSISSAAKQANFTVAVQQLGQQQQQQLHEQIDRPVPSRLPARAWAWDRHVEVCEYFLRWLHAFLAITNQHLRRWPNTVKKMSTHDTIFMTFFFLFVIPCAVVKCGYMQIDNSLEMLQVKKNGIVCIKWFNSYQLSISLFLINR